MKTIYCSNYDCPELEVNSEMCRKSEVKINEFGCEFYRQFKTVQKVKEIGIELNECPFCGGEGEIIIDFIGGYRAICRNCFIMSNNLADIESVAEAWNKRYAKIEGE